MMMVMDMEINDTLIMSVATNVNATVNGFCVSGRRIEQIHRPAPERIRLQLIQVCRRIRDM